MKPKAFLKAKFVRVVELVDTADLKSASQGSTGSSPVANTIVRKDVTLVRKGNDGRIQVFTSTRKGFLWIRNKYPEFGTIDLIIANDGEADEFVKEMRAAGLNVLFP